MSNTLNKSAGQQSANSFGDALLAANFTPPELRTDKEFGLQLLKRIYKEQKTESSSFYLGARNVRWYDIWQWAMGRQSMQTFLDYTSIDGDKSYTNIDFTQNRIGPQFLETLVDSICQTKTYASVTACDDHSKEEKERLKKEALYRMHEADTVSSLQQQAGMLFEPKDAYVPDDEAAAEVYFQLEHRLPYEIEQEKLLAGSMKDNEYETTYRSLVRYLIALNCGITKIEKNEYGRVGMKYCMPPNIIFNFFTTDSGKKELSYIGEVYSLKIRELRRKYGQSPTNPNGLSEKEIFEMAKYANQYNNANRFYYYWNDSFLYATDRPYDDFGIQVLDCEIKLFDTDYYVEKKDSFGNDKIIPKKNRPNPTSEQASIIGKPKYTVYRGIWAMKADKMIYWGLPDIVIKPYQDITESLFSYTIRIPNNDGDYMPSLFERGMEVLREYQLLKLRRKQLIAGMVPSGYSIDVETARDIDLGNGNKIGWEEVLKIRNQSGVVVWSSKGLNPNETNRTPPVIEMANAGSVAQLQEINNTMDRCMAEIRGLYGVSVFRDGSDLKPRMGQAVVENQASSANNVTDFINFAARELMQETLHKMSIVLWDEQTLVQGKDELLNVSFEVNVEIFATDYEQEQTEKNIAIGMQEGLLSFKDAFYIRNIKNYKLQQLYLASVVEKNKREQAKTQQQAIQQNAQAQMASNQQQAQNQAQMEQAKMMMEFKMEEQKASWQKEISLLNGLFAVIAKSEGNQIPDYLQPLATEMFKNVALPVRAENMALQGGMNAMTNVQNTPATPEQQAQQVPQQ